MLESYRDAFSDPAHDFFESLLIYVMQIGSQDTHSAPDIHTHCIGDDRILCRQHSADGHPITLMGIRHNGDMPESKGQICQILCLLQSTLLNVIKPHFDGQLLSCNNIHLYSSETLLFFLNPFLNI